MIPRQFLSLSSAATLVVCALLLLPQLAVGAPHHHGQHRHLPQGAPQQAQDHPAVVSTSSPPPVVISEHTPGSPPMHVQGAGRRVVGYYTNWAQYRSDPYKFYPENMDGTLFTHAIFAFAKVTPSFEVVPYEWNDVLDNGQGMYARFNAGLRKANPAIKTLISLGGWNFSQDEATKGIFPAAAASESSRKTFAGNVARFCRTHGFDGVDVDWEYPAEADRDNFSLLMQALRDEFAADAADQKERLLLTAAVWANHNKVAACYDMKKLAITLDFINLMTYDLYGSWDDVTGAHTALNLPGSYDGTKFSVARGVHAWLDGGVPASQLVLGLATYGRSFMLQGASTPLLGAATAKPAPSGPFTKEAGFLAYYEILKMQSEGMACTLDADTSTMVGTKDSLWVGYDNEATLKVKVDYLNTLGLSGAMFWAVDLDDFKNGSPLIRSVAKQLL